MASIASAVPPPRARVKAALALLLTFAAGCVDITGYITLYHVFTAHMTGDTVHLAQSVLTAQWVDAARAACVIAAFMLGSVVGRTIIEVGSRARFRHIATANLLAEALLISAAIPLARNTDGRTFLVLAMLAAAMGLQTATLTRVGALTVHTTFVTGMLNKLAQLLSHGLFLSYDKARGRPATGHLLRVFREARFMSSIWLLYLLGAAMGTWFNRLWGAQALLVPAAIVATAVIADQVAPVSAEEERDDPDR
jgi:uncharacterized membrane protein YoaK (UPF0700 family)